jgi:hypothetical protein
MPNEVAASYLRATPIPISIPGHTPLPIFRGRRLYYPLYARSFSGYMAGMDSGLGFVDFLAVPAAIGSTLSAIGSVLATIATTVAQILVSIIGFILDTVVTIVNTILSAVSGLAGAALDLLGLKGDGDLSGSELLEMGLGITAKYNSLNDSDKKGERPLTNEEQAGYDNNMGVARRAINSLVGALGGTTNTILLGVAAAGAVFLMGR